MPVFELCYSINITAATEEEARTRLQELLNISDTIEYIEENDPGLAANWTCEEIIGEDSSDENIDSYSRFARCG